MSDLYIIGAGGHGAGIAELAVELGYAIDGFVDSDPTRINELVLGWPVLGGYECIPKGASVALGVGNNHARFKLIKKATDCGWELPTLVHPSAVVSPSVHLSIGTVIMPQCVVGARTKLGIACILSIAAAVSHDCNLGNAVHMANGVNIGGYVNVGDCTLLGVGCCVRPNSSIGRNVVIGAGSVVVSDIPNDVVAFGNPAKIR